MRCEFGDECKKYKKEAELCNLYTKRERTKHCEPYRSLIDHDDQTGIIHIIEKVTT